MKKYAIIVAGGSGTRMDSTTPKQFLDLAGKPILMHTIDAFYLANMDIDIIVVLPDNQKEHWNELCDKHEFTTPHRLTTGGKERYHSVKNGLKLTEPDSLVAVHDGVRPLVSIRIIHTAYKLAEEYGIAIPTITPTESVRMMEEPETVTVDRNRIRIIQTPQAFKTNILTEAYRQPYRKEFTDDASIVEYANHPITLFHGSEENIKITTLLDLKIAKTILLHQFESLLPL
ncbi:MAG: 2-C-methyl-D-erythritol 4-phosphate cytidylyltransferase [Bacteroidales bacterium]|nr:2-C-methyl-D-erythritol 4-phosphate cytidylyltransferase [Bacteroidales bacterium]MDD3011054.1 2-C-methyl-D-erythritol 4-phosphate cytidylyltransferase [Bacteroidales bacterium]MDD3962023.1 2-C-methyl-D-erythritol 4-phosphate cytidylyltransferase [Bacteroidales bacterium]MDY0286100.1 2-C-methyl-D-erythritol 4-phosphate cytidylyltransferase [Bacteroidales bacterium]HPE87499.1 2-C-methyl-D-erythritol 4-phosphate cytidylyltransferase [Bacteroidales bacterium]